MNFFARLSYYEFAAAALGGLVAAVDAHLWTPWQAFALMLTVAIVETAATTWYQQKRRPTWRELGWMVAAYTVILFFVHGFAKYVPGLSWLPLVTLPPLAIFHLRALVITCGRLGYTKREVSDLLDVGIRARFTTDQPERPAA